MAWINSRIETKKERAREIKDREIKSMQSEGYIAKY